MFWYICGTDAAHLPSCEMVGFFGREPSGSGLETIWPGLQEVLTPNECAPIKLGVTDADTNESSPKLGGPEKACQETKPPPQGQADLSVNAGKAAEAHPE